MSFEFEVVPQAQRLFDFVGGVNVEREALTAPIPRLRFGA